MGQQNKEEDRLMTDKRKIERTVDKFSVEQHSYIHEYNLIVHNLCEIWCLYTT